jgi:hypothetical protein
MYHPRMPRLEARVGWSGLRHLLFVQMRHQCKARQFWLFSPCLGYKPIYKIAYIM